MKSSLKKSFAVVLSIFLIAALTSCHSGTSSQSQNNTDSTAVQGVDTSKTAAVADTTAGNTEAANASVQNKASLPKVLIYNFHVTNRCASCIAIEDATTKTLNTFFSKEMKEGRITRQILNVDDEANKTVSEKYQAFGSGIVVTRVFKGKETTTDLTGDGFKYAKNKEERFIEILKSKISEYLK